MFITANLPMFTMRSFKERGITYTVLAMESNIKAKHGGRMTHYQVDIHLPVAVKTLSGYSSQSHTEAFRFAKRRGKNWINKVTLQTSKRC